MGPSQFGLFLGFSRRTILNKHLESSQDSKLSEFYFELGLAQKNFRAEANKKFDLKQFRKASIRIIYDSLHGISADAISLSNAVEIMAYCLVDGKVEQGSKFEKTLCDNLLKQFKSSNDLTKRSLALCWIYLKMSGEYTQARKK